MDTEFPGVVATPLGTFKSKEDFNYQQVSCNVNMLKLIQVFIMEIYAPICNLYVNNCLANISELNLFYSFFNSFLFNDMIPIWKIIHGQAEVNPDGLFKLTPSLIHKGQQV